MSDIDARLERAEATASLALGRTKALEYGLRALIISHPYTEQLNLLWQAILVEITDEHMDIPDDIFHPDMFSGGMQDALTALTGQIDNARNPL